MGKNNQKQRKKINFSFFEKRRLCINVGYSVNGSGRQQPNCVDLRGRITIRKIQQVELRPIATLLVPSAISLSLTVREKEIALGTRRVAMGRSSTCCIFLVQKKCTAERVLFYLKFIRPILKFQFPKLFYCFYDNKIEYFSEDRAI